MDPEFPQLSRYYLRVFGSFTMNQVLFLVLTCIVFRSLSIVAYLNKLVLSYAYNVLVIQNRLTIDFYKEFY